MVECQPGIIGGLISELKRQGQIRCERGSGGPVGG